MSALTADEQHVADAARDFMAAHVEPHVQAWDRGLADSQAVLPAAGADELLHPPGEAFEAALASINGARTCVAAMCCGMVQKSLRVVSAYGSMRHTCGKPLHEHQSWRWSLAGAAIDLAAARSMVDGAT